MEDQTISFVIPCYKSEKTIIMVLDELKKVMDQLGNRYEIITVNDCSPDNVWSVLMEQVKLDSSIVAVDLASNVGKQGAVMAGFQYTSGNIIVCLDDDGQCPVDHLPKLLKALNDDYDIAMAQYGEKEQSRFRNAGSRLVGKTFDILMNKPKDLQLTNFYAMKRFVVEKIIEYRNPYPYLHGLMLRTTSRIVGVPMQERKRLYGNSGYTLHKLISFWIDGVTGFSVKPLRVAAFVGFLSAFSGFALALFLIIKKIFIAGSKVAGWTSMISALLFIGGFILLFMGIIGEYVGRIYLSLNAAPQFVVRKVIDSRKGTNKHV